MTTGRRPRHAADGQPAPCHALAAAPGGVVPVTCERLSPLHGDVHAAHYRGAILTWATGDPVAVHASVALSSLLADDLPPAPPPRAPRCGERIPFQRKGLPFTAGCSLARDHDTPHALWHPADNGRRVLVQPPAPPQLFDGLPELLAHLEAQRASLTDANDALRGALIPLPPSPDTQ